MNYTKKSFSVPMGSSSKEFADRWEKTFGKVSPDVAPACDGGDCGYPCPRCDGAYGKHSVLDCDGVFRCVCAEVAALP